MSAAQEVTTANFQASVLDSELPCLVDFWASWCGPCRMVGPIVEEIAAEKAGSLNVCKLNVDEQPDLVARYSVSSIPTLILFKAGKPAHQIVGAAPKAELLRQLEPFI